MSSRSEGEREVARAAADAREAAREITHSRTERARVLGERERPLRDDAHVEQQAVQQGGRFLGVGVTGDTVGPELAEYVEAGAGATEETRDSVAAKAGDLSKDLEDTATEKAMGTGAYVAE